MAITVNQSLSVVSTNASNNTAVVRYTVTCSVSGESYNGYTQTGNFNIDGTNYSNSYTLPRNSTTTVFSKDVTVGNASGRTIGASYSFPTTPSGGTKTGNTSVKIPTLVSAPTLNSLTLKRRTSTSLTFGFTCSKADTFYYKLSSAGGYTQGSSGNITSGEFTISNLSPNTKYTINFIVRNWAGSNAMDTHRNIEGTTFAKTIPTISLSSKTVNSITVSSGCNVSVSNTQYRIKTSNGNYGAYQNSATFSNLSPNTTYTVEVKKVGKDSGEVGTATLNVSTYQIATISSAPNINFGDTARVIKTNPSSAHNRLRIETLNPANTVVTRDNIGNDYTIILNDSEWDTLYKKLGTSNSITIRYVIDTIQNNVTYYNYVDRTLTLKGNQKTAHVGQNGKKRAKVYVGVNGSVKRAVVWIGNNGRKRCI